MTDYSAVPVAPIANGVVQIVGGVPVISGRGFSTIARGVNPVGDFIISLDVGTGIADVGSGQVTVVNGQAVPGFGYANRQVGPNGLDPNMARVAIMLRGQVIAGLPTTRVASKDVTYLTSPGQGAIQFEVVTSSVAGAPIDPVGANGNGFEILVFYGNATPDTASETIVGPLFQPAFKFP